MLLATYQFAWSIFRFGPKYGVAWPDGQFPIDKVDELYKQVIPDLISDGSSEPRRAIRIADDRQSDGRKHGDSR